MGGRRDVLWARKGDAMTCLPKKPYKSLWREPSRSLSQYCSVSQDCLRDRRDKSVQKEGSTKVPYKSVPQEFSTSVSQKFVFKAYLTIVS